MDEEKLQITKNRIAALRSNSFLSLEDSLVKSIVRNIDFYIENVSLADLNIYMRQKVLEILLKDSCHDEYRDAVRMSNYVAALSQLLSSLTVQLNLSNLMTFCSADLKKSISEQLLRLVAANAPNINSLAFEETTKTRKMFLDSMCLDEDILNSIEKLRKLTILKMDIRQFRRADLIKTCEKLLLLRDIKVDIVFDQLDSNKEDFRDLTDNMKHLKNFRFKAFVPFQELLIESSEYQNKLSRACFKELPDLEIIGYDATSVGTPYNMSSFCVGQQLESKLRHLQIVLNDFEGPESYKKFPNISHLKLGWSPTNIHTVESLAPLLHFPEMSYLNLLEIPSVEMLNKLLGSYGHQLQTLTISNSVKTLELTLKSIAQSSPRLEYFSLFGLIDVVDFSQDHLPFSHLKFIEWRVKSVKGIKTLQKVLSVASLEKVYLKCQTFDPIELKELAAIVENGQILRKLKSFELSIDSIMNNPDAYDACSNLLKNMMTHLPNLTNVDVITNNWRKFIDTANASNDIMLLKFLSAITNG